MPAQDYHGPLPFEMIITELHDNYMRCIQSNGVSSIGDAVSVAKPPLLRRQEYDGLMKVDPVSLLTFSYTYTGNQERTVSTSEGSEDQVVTPRYITGLTILAMACAGVSVLKDDGETEEFCGYVEIGQGRSWAKYTPPEEEE